MVITNLYIPIALGMQLCAVYWDANNEYFAKYRYRGGGGGYKDIQLMFRNFRGQTLGNTSL